MANEKPEKPVTLKPGQILITSVLNLLSKTIGEKKKDPKTGIEKQDEATQDGEPHTLNMYFPGWDESKLSTWEGLAEEVIRVGKQFSAMKEANASIIYQTPSGDTIEKKCIAVREHPCKDAVGFFPSDVCDSPEKFYALFVQGLRQAASTLAGNTLKSEWVASGTGGTRGGPKSEAKEKLV